MRTAIFVYNATQLYFSTCENNLELSRMNADTVPLSSGDSSRTLDPGIYKIVSSHDVKVAGDPQAFESFVTTENKDNDPRLPPLRATQSFAVLDTSALKAFMAVEEAKDLANP
jgi:hypothetical protein